MPQVKRIQELEAENVKLRELINLIDRWSNDAITGKRSCESAIVQISARLVFELKEWEYQLSRAGDAVE